MSKHRVRLVNVISQKRANLQEIMGSKFWEFDE